MTIYKKTTDIIEPRTDSTIGKNQYVLYWNNYYE